jgi:hypothetical protein
MKPERKENIKKIIEEKGLKCECGQTVYRVWTDPIEGQPNYNKYFEYLESLNCRRLYYL